MLNRSLASLGVVGTVGLVASFAPASDFDVVINEIHYNPLSGLQKDEFVELVNRGPTTVDLGGWRFVEGIDLLIPPGTLLEPRAYLVVSPDAAYAVTRHALTRAVGDYLGKLDNDGEIITLVNRSGDIMSRVHYGDEGSWPSRPDGLGPSLEILDPHAQPDLARNWSSSLFVDGTPGAINSRSGQATGVSRVIVGAQDLWRYLKGTQEASNPRTAWTTTGFTDTTWATGAGGFGYGGAQPSFETELTDMQGQGGYTTLYIRAKFTLSAADVAAVQNGEMSLTLTVRFDDAFVAYLNGMEAGRENAANAGTPPAFDAVADGSLNSQAFVSLDGFASSLVAGQNVIAVHGINNVISSSDFLLEAELRIAERPPSTTDSRSQVTLNEVMPTDGASTGFIELYNSGASGFALSQHRVIDSLGHSFTIPAGTVVSARGWRTFSATSLGFSPVLAGATHVLVKVDAGSGDLEFVDALNPRGGPAGSSGLSFGRFPDGGDDLYLMTAPTQGAANGVALSPDVVLNEIQFHPPFAAPGGGCTRSCSDAHQWIELHNKGTGAVNVTGWSISKGVDFLIPASPGVSIPAGGFLVIASSRATFLADHPGFDAARVLGDWVKDLAHDSDTINVNDALGNRVDHVKYGDGKPLNDQEPEDDVDDRTFLGSEWPTTSDGTGRSIELIHPHLDNRDGNAWAPGPMGGTPGAANAALTAVPFPIVGKIDHSPAVPRPTETVTVKCRVSATQAISAVEAIWHREDAAGGGTVTLRDDGLSGDGAAGDGEYAGLIPAQPDRAVVGFQVRARLADGKTTTVPRSPAVPPYGGFAGPYYLYQVLATSPPLNPSENYFVVMAAADLNELRTRPEESNVMLPCTFIHVARDGDSSVRHLCGLRYRGEQTRTDERKGYRVNFPSEHDFQGIEHMNLLAAQVDRELLVSDLFRRAGMPYPVEWSVNLTFQGTLDPRYAFKEHLDSNFLSRFFGDASDSENFYRAIDPTGDPRAGDLTYFGEDPAEYAPYYEKRSNKEENDYSDLVELCRAFDPAQTPDNVFPDLLETLIDVNQWARYLAIQSCISNIDGSIQTASGEDYFLYRVPITSGRPDAGLWILAPWDIEESMSTANQQLFSTRLPSVRRFLTHTRFAPLYYANLINLRDGVFSRFETRQRFVLIDFLFGFGTIDGIDTFITTRIGFIDSNVPTELSAGAVSSIAGTPLVQIGEMWKYWKGTEAPAGAALAWTQRVYAETNWLSGPTGIGYDDGDDATVLDDMQMTTNPPVPGYTTVYARRTFPIADPAAIQALDLVIDYDDGFVAYLNGTEVARSGNVAGSVGSAVPFDATASPTREAGTPVTINISAFKGSLVAGNNVLAIQVLNQAIDSSDLSLLPELLSGGTPTGGIGCGTVLYSTTDTMNLSGRANAYLTRSVKVNDTLVPYDTYRAVWTATVALGPGDNTAIVKAYDGDNGTGSLIESRTLTVRRLTRAPTQISGTLSGAPHWTEAGGPYLMTGNVTIPAGSRLDIDPGVLIIGEAGASIVVQGTGTIQALGTAQKPILFRALSCNNRWGGIAIDNTGTSGASPTQTLRYCDLEFGDNPANYAGCVAPVGSKILIDHCSFRFLTANAVDGTNARVEVRSSLFEKINEGVHCTSSTVIILDSTFRGMVGDTDGIDFDLNGSERSRIERCLIEDGSDDGIDLQETTVDIRDSVFRNISDKVLSLEMNGPLGPPTITGNLIYNSGSAIALKSGISVTECHHNTVVGNQEGVNLFAKAGASDGGHGIFHSMILWDNIADVKLDSLSTASFTFSNVSSGVRTGTGNISSDPRFVNVAADNYALRSGSPCIDTGKDTSDMGAIPFTGSPPTFLRSDSDASQAIGINDVVFTLIYIFRGGAIPPCLDAADANDDGAVDISDPVFTLFFLYAGGRNPPAPYPVAGEDATADGLTCN